MYWHKNGNHEKKNTVKLEQGINNSLIEVVHLAK